MGKIFRRWHTFFLLFFFVLLTLVRISGAEQGGGEDIKLGSLSWEETGFHGLWVQRQEMLAKEGTVVGEQQLEEIITLKLNKGIMNLWEYALLLAREGIKLQDKNKAMKLGEFSQRMAPDLPYVYFYAGQTIWAKERWKVYQTLEKYFEGIKAYTRNVPLASGQGLNLLYLLGLGALLAVLAFCLLVFLKRLPIYIHALKEELRGGRDEIIRGIGRIFLLFVPFLLQLNIIWCGLFWCLILWKYLTRGEKVVVVVSLFLVTYISPVGKALLNFAGGPEVQTVFDLYETTYGEREPKAMERLQLRTTGHPKDRDVLFTLGLAFKREGNYRDARQYYQKVMRFNPSDHDVISNLGNLYLALDEPENAIRLYQQAIKGNPHNGVYYFNLSKALPQKSMLLLHDADTNFQKAKELSPKVISSHFEIDSPHPNRNVIDEVIPVEHLLRRLFNEFWRGTGSSFFLPWISKQEVQTSVWLRDLSPRFPFICPLVFFILILLIVVSYGGKGRLGWWRCSLCGLISTQTYARKEERKKICIRCFRILQGKEMNQELKETKLKAIKVFQRRRGFYEGLIPILLPGGGHVWKGYNLRGLFFLWIFFVFLGKFYHWKGIVPSAIPWASYGMNWGGLVIIVAFVIFYLLVLKGVYKKKGLEVLEPPFSLEGIRR